MFKIIKKLKFALISICVIILLISVASYADLLLYKNKTEDLPNAKQVSNDDVIDDNKTSSKTNENSYETKENLTKKDENVANTNKDSSTSENNSSTSEKVFSKNDTHILFLDDKSNYMVIASINKKSKKINLTQIKDKKYTYLDDKEKLLQSIEKDNDIKLEKFVQVNLEDLMNVVDVIGGIDVAIKEEDLEVINNLIPKYFSEYAKSNNTDMELLQNPGTQSLNEYQAMAYANVVSKDISKQKEALNCVMKNLKDLSFTKYIEIFKTIKPYVQTNLNFTDMITLATYAIK
ncbi:LCP family protein [Terrisporobacter sp.]|uniref:LCP family protein n=1 Tax=Terrisporobacter sp. TaxID=1965305 RepID=UPI00261FDDDB|nr:LCP family protein [Terrisporobacter sp.]